MDNFEQSVVLVDSQVFDDCLALGGELLSGSALCETRQEVRVDLLERGMAPIDEVSEVVNGGRLILDKDQNQVQSKSGQGLLVTCCID